MSAAAGNYRLGIDIGGTFTDFCLMNEATGELMSVKVPSTPSHPTRSVLEGIKVYGERYQVPPQGIRYFAHGTTIAVNTVIERKGARTGLLVTKGFKDILNLGRSRLPDIFDYFTEKPEPLVARRHVKEIGERMLKTGATYKPLPEAEVVQAVKELIADGVEAVTVSFLHSYKNAEARAAGEGDHPAPLPRSLRLDLVGDLAADPRIRAHARHDDQRLRRPQDGELLQLTGKGSGRGRGEGAASLDQVERRHHDRRQRARGAGGNAHLGPGLGRDRRPLCRQPGGLREADRHRHGRHQHRGGGDRRRYPLLDRVARRRFRHHHAGGRRRRRSARAAARSPGPTPPAC